MKCIQCGNNNNYRDRQRNGGSCKACRHKFAFEPYTDPLKISDSLFHRMIQGVSDDGQVFFTERQLWYEFNRYLWHKRLRGQTTVFMWIFGVGGIGASIVLASLWPLVIGGLGIVFAAIARSGRLFMSRQPLVMFNSFRKDVDRWTQAHGEIEKLVQIGDRQPNHHQREAEPDLTAYSFDRALVTDKTEVAAMLVANNFHFENNCAILSVAGYPEDITDIVMEMLRRNPQLKVFALHDASTEGCKLPLTLREEKWFPDQAISIIDLGLRPQHVKKMRVFTLAGRRQTLPTEVRELLTVGEAAWLERGNTVELEVLRPVGLIRAIYRGFTYATQISEDGARGAWIYGSGMELYLWDSFG
jgi:hypothetical protein